MFQCGLISVPSWITIAYYLDLLERKQGSPWHSVLSAQSNGGAEQVRACSVGAAQRNHYFVRKTSSHRARRLLDPVLRPIEKQNISLWKTYIGEHERSRGGMPICSSGEHLLDNCEI